jgi:hypothetical protein
MIDFDNSDIRKKRILKGFIEAVKNIIEKDGIERVTIRKVAQMAGYNSATIYNYFDNCNQLIFFGAISFMDDYVKDIPRYLGGGSNTLEQFLLIWECFIRHSFINPWIYYAIFTEDIGGCSENLFKKYYQLFPDELGDIPQKYIPMLLESELSKRCSLHIQPCVEEGYFSPKKAEEVDEKIRLIYHGMLSLLVNNRLKYSADEAVSKSMMYIHQITYNAIDNL